MKIYYFNTYFLLVFEYMNFTEYDIRLVLLMSYVTITYW